MRAPTSSPASSWTKWEAFATSSAGPAPGISSAIRSAACGGKIGSESPKSTSAGFVQRSTCSRTPSIGAVFGCSGSVGTSSGNISAPTFDSGVGKGASYARSTSSESPRAEPDSTSRAISSEPPSSRTTSRKRRHVLLGVVRREGKTRQLGESFLGRPVDVHAGDPMSFLPRDFVVPALVETERFRLRSITIDDAEKEWEALNASRAHLRGLFGDAWEAADAHAAADLFTDDAEYRPHPLREPFRGRAAIADYWTRATAAQGEAYVRFGWPVGNGSRVAVEWWTTIRDDEGGEVTIPGCLVLRFAPDGRCAALRQYWHVEGGRSSPHLGWGS